MSSVQPCSLPDGALLSIYRRDGAYTDCYSADVADTVTHEEFVTAFYTTLVFKLEGSILKWVVAKPSTDAQAKQMASGSIDHFAAWQVEQRCPDQVLLSDFRARTRSWLMVAPTTVHDGPGTRLYFGSAVVPVTNRKTGGTSLGPIFRALLGIHRIYSVVLLRAARSRLIAQRSRQGANR